MTYLEKYPNCDGCPVYKWCGTAVSSIRLCHSYNDAVAENQRASHVLTLSKAAQDDADSYAEEKLGMWDNVTD